MILNSKTFSFFFQKVGALVQNFEMKRSSVKGFEKYKQVGNKKIGFQNLK